MADDPPAPAQPQEARRAVPDPDEARRAVPQPEQARKAVANPEEVRSTVSKDAPEAQPFPAEADIDAVLYEFKGDAREAIRALLHDLAILAADYGSSVSHGYVRGEIPRLVLVRRA